MKHGNCLTLCPITPLKGSAIGRFLPSGFSWGFVELKSQRSRSATSTRTGASIRSGSSEREAGRRHRHSPADGPAYPRIRHPCRSCRGFERPALSTVEAQRQEAGASTRHEPGYDWPSRAQIRLVVGYERGYSAHSMRATFITTALENGAKIEDVQKAAAFAISPQLSSMTDLTG